MGGEGPPASELRLAGGRRWAAGDSCAPMIVQRRTGHAPGPTSLDAWRPPPAPITGSYNFYNFASGSRQNA